MDEPTSMIDPLGKNLIFDILRKLKEAGEHTLIIAEHNVEQLAPLADQMILMHDGQVDKVAEPREFFSDPAYLEERGVVTPESTEFGQWLRAENYIAADSELPLGLEEGIRITKEAIAKRSKVA